MSALTTNLNHAEKKKTNHVSSRLWECSELRSILIDGLLLADQAGAALSTAAERVAGLLEDIQRRRDAVVAGEARHLAVRGEDVRHLVLGGAAHHRDLGAHVDAGAYVIRPVRLAQHAVHVGADGVELERHVEVGHASVLGGRDAVPVDPRVLLGDRHRVGHDPEPPVEPHHHAVGRARAEHGQRGRRGRAPAGALRGVQVDRRAVEGDDEAVHGGVPRGGAPHAEVQAVRAEADAQRLHPREVARGRGVALADEVRVDVEVGVRDQAEVGVAPPVEQELVAVAAHEAWVVALRPGQVAHCTPNFIHSHHHQELIKTDRSNKISGRTNT
ncbi:hypothetical protein PR202_gb07549 [Eleusine coracana subsp. coracana]|uniref:Uncharacterized protein n=1 Tax=Eleusine coracana subsp. coracana TaxID=191504 RepID=A0AAV5ECE0_ELECO|nr:hypothetical protein PR202_gb07549 [Eleusine coracana subsp. coracana]